MKGALFIGISPVQIEETHAAQRAQDSYKRVAGVESCLYEYGVGVREMSAALRNFLVALVTASASPAAVPVRP
jgi:hypothetical protein